MVQTDVAQRSAEITEWRQILRNHREEFQNCRHALSEICRQNLSREHLLQVEHFDNQFHIQLINIHDLKQAIKSHERSLALDREGEAVYRRHEELLSEFIQLENTLINLRGEFKDFISLISC